MQENRCYDISGLINGGWGKKRKPIYSLLTQWHPFPAPGRLFNLSLGSLFDRLVILICISISIETTRYRQLSPTLPLGILNRAERIVYPWHHTWTGCPT